MQRKRKSKKGSMFQKRLFISEDKVYQIFSNNVPISILS